jgi:hypothetical protein
MTTLRLREIVNLDDGSTWGHVVSVLEPAVIPRQEQSQVQPQPQPQPSSLADTSPAPDVASIVSAITECFAALPTQRTDDTNPGQQPRRVILTLPHRYWSADLTVTRICELLRTCIPGIYQSVELDLALATTAEVAIAARLRTQGTANVVVTNVLSDPQWVHINRIKPHAVRLADTTVARIISGEYSPSVTRTAFELVRVLDILTIAGELEHAEQAQLLRELGCALGIYRTAP